MHHRRQECREVLYYITECVLEHEEGERICFRLQSLDVLADMIAQKIREKQGKGMGMGL